MPDSDRERLAELLGGQGAGAVGLDFRRASPQDLGDQRQRPPMAPDRWRAISDSDDDAIEREAVPRPVAAVEAAQLPPGTPLGPYLIEARIGAGGMGQVYRARDTRLDRIVAIKVLPPHLRYSTDRQARFEREARAISRLTHPYICTLYDVGCEGDIEFLVMEHLDGETLASRLSRGAVALDQALRVGTEIASALAHAHRQGVIHRDLKPSNVMLTTSGTKLLDFGIAKLGKSAKELSPAHSTATTGTAEGALIGTLAYMAPEHLQGHEVDARADIWALGCVLYELATGRRAFEGRTQATLIAAILGREPDPLLSVQPLAPPSLENVVRGCLAKEREERWQSAADVERQLQWIARGGEPESPSWGPGSGAWRRLERRAILGVVAAAVLLLLLGAWRRWGTTPVSDPSFEVSTAVVWPSAESQSRLSPDGSWLSFVSDRDGRSRLFVRNLRSGETTPLDVPAGGLWGHAWSPDGQEIAILLKQGQMVTMAIVPAFFGGSPRAVTRVEETARRLARWIGTTVYVEERFELVAVDTVSGAVTKVARPDPTRFPIARAFDVGSDGRIAFSAQVEGNEDIWLIETPGGAPRRLTDHPGSDLAPVLAGRHLFFQSSRGGQADVWRLDLVDHALTQLTRGGGEVLPEDAISDGKLVSVTYSTASAEIWAIDTSTRQAWAVTSESVQDLWPSFSRDGTLIAYQRRKGRLDTLYIEGEAEIVVGRWDGRRIVQSRVAVPSGFAPRLSPDGRRLAYLEWGRDGHFVALKVRDLDAGRTVTVTERFIVPGYLEFPLDWKGVNFLWSGEGSDLFFCERDSSGAPRIARFAAGAPETVHEIVKLPGGGPTVRDLWLSPDGSRLAYNRYAVQASILVVRDLAHGLEKQWLTDRHGRQGRVQVIGWDGERLLVIRGRRTELPAESLDILALDGPGEPAVLRQNLRGHSHTARLDVTGRRLFVTLQEDGVDKVFGLPLDRGSPVRMTSNDVPSVTFSNVQLAPGGTILYARQDRKQDIWLIRQAERR